MNLFSTIKGFQISLFFIIIYFPTIISIKGGYYRIFISFFSKITIKINSSGKQNIFYKYFLNYPNRVLINNNSILANIQSNFLYLNETFNIVELNWINDLTSCEKMFYKCEEIVEVDLSQFKGINIVKFNYMFGDCFLN